MAKRTTKKDMEKQLAEMQSKIDTLTKENTELRIKISWYEKLPENACNAAAGCVDWFTKVVFTQQKQEQQKQ